MKIVPMNNNILCKQLVGSKSETAYDYQHSKLYVTVDSLPIYEVIDLNISSNKKHNISLKKGDKIIVNSTGTAVTVENQTFMLFNIDNVAAKIL